MIQIPYRIASYFLASIIGIPLASAQTTIYSDNFDGGTGDIHTVGPDVRPGGETWTASTIFNADGSLDRVGPGSMTLPFTPANDFVYTLDASFSGVNGDTDWLALGFASGQSATSTNNDRFVGGTVSGTTWMLFRGATPAPLATNGNKIHRGPGTADPADWLDPTLWDLEGGDIDLRIVLDTTGGPGAWTATWYAKLPADDSYTLIGDTTTVPHDPSNYTSVGIAASNTSSTTGTGGTIESFSLTASGGENTPPEILAKIPHDTSGVYPGTDLVATFNEDIVLKPGGTITIRNLGDPSGASDTLITLPDARVTLSGRDLVIDPATNLSSGTSFAVRISPDAVEDTASPPSAFVGITDDVTWTFSTAAEDLTAPVITMKSPLDNAADVSRATNIVATFDDDIVVGTGNITLKDLDDGSTTLIIPVSDNAQVSISGKVLTIVPTASLAAGKNYAVQIAAGAVKNFSDVGFVGIPETDDITWNFQTLATSPNVIFILGDDQGWYDYGFMQRPGVDKAAVELNPAIPMNVVKTPAIDRLADEGLAFIHGYSAPVCRPALTSIITGTYLQQHWITGNDLVNFRGSGNTRIDDTPVEARMQVLNPLPRTLFNELGYTSFQTGKWWEGHHTNGGFTHGDTANSTAGGTAPPQWSGSRPSYVTARHGDWGLMTGRVDYVNDIQAPAHPIPYANTVQTVTDFIDTQVTADQPFFLWYAPFLPHTPHDPPSGLLAEYSGLGLSSADAKYYANIERFDGGVGAILDHLDTKGIADNTIIIMICDNGRQYDLTTLGKLTPYESGVRSPIIVRWPDRIKPGGSIEPGIVRTPVSMVDMVPTVHHALGLPTFPEMRGIDLLDPVAVAARGSVCGSDHDVEILTLSDPTESLESRFAVRDGWKLILFTNGNKELYQLYDGATPVDPHETTNLAADNPEIVSELTMEIVNWYAVEPNDFDTWISDPALGIALANRGFDQDPDGDKLTNGIESWFGTHPGEFTPGLAVIEASGTSATFQHPHNANPPGDLSGQYEWSLNLVDWYAGDGVNGPPGGPTVDCDASTSGTITTVNATASQSLERMFLRVAVSRN